MHLLQTVSEQCVTHLIKQSATFVVNLYQTFSLATFKSFQTKPILTRPKKFERIFLLILFYKYINKQAILSKDKRLYAEWSEAEKFGVFLHNKCSQVNKNNLTDIWSGKFGKLPDIVILKIVTLLNCVIYFKRSRPPWPYKWTGICFKRSQPLDCVIYFKRSCPT